MNNTETVKRIEDNPTLKQILKDSFGGVMYNLSNLEKYDTTILLEEWNSLTKSEQESKGGLINGAIKFITTKH